MLSIPFSSNDYRFVLRKWVSQQPKKGRGELKTMAELLRIPSPVFSQILSGSRELSEDQAYLLSQHMGFNELQKDYFICLVQIERSSHHEYKEHLKTKMKMLREKSQNLASRLDHEKVLSEKDQAEFYSSWHYSAIGLFCDLHQGASIEQIATEFHLKRDRTMRILEFLEKVGLIILENGKYKIGPARTHLSKDSPYISRHHANWRIRAIERSQDLKSTELMFTGPLTISESDFSKLREKMMVLVQEVSDVVKESKSEKLACFNIDFFEIK